MVEALETKPQTEQPPLLYDLTTLQREANGRFGFSASRTLGTAQALYDQHKLLTYPRTNSRFLSGDMAGQLKRVVSGVGAAAREYAAPGALRARASTACPLGRVVNDARVTDHHAIIPTEGDHDLSGPHPRRAPHLRHGRPPLPRGLPPRRQVRADRGRDAGAASTCSAAAARS